MEDYERSSRSKVATTNINVELVHNLIMCEKRSLHDIVKQIGISFGAV